MDFMAKIESETQLACLSLEEKEIEMILLEIAVTKDISTRFAELLRNAADKIDIHGNFDIKQRTKILHFVTFMRLANVFRSSEVIEWARSQGLDVCVALDRKICSAAVKDLEVTNMDAYGTMDVTVDLYQMLSDKDEAVAILKFIAHEMNQFKALEILERITVKHLKEIQAAHLAEVCSGLVCGSNYPLISSVQCAGLFQQLSKIYVSDCEGYLNEYKAFTQTTLNLVDDFPSDQIALLFLEEVGPSGQSAIEEAVRTNNYELLKNPRVARIMDSMWSVPFFMTADSLSTGRGLKNAVVFLARNPWAFFRLPFGKFIVRALNYLMFVAFFSYTFCISHRTLSSEYSIDELVLEGMALGFILTELKEIYLQGMASYFEDEWNIVDDIIYIGFAIIIVLRALSYFIPGFGEETIWVLIYEIAVTSNAIFMYIRILYVFAIHPTLGPLQQTIFRMTGDIRNFFFILILFWFGFSVAFFFLLNPEIEQNDSLEGFITITQSVLTTYIAMLGSFDYDSFNNIDDDIIRVFTRFMFTLYLSIAIIILLNLVIAMMARTFSAVQEASISAFLFGKAKMTHQYDKMGCELPPPFSILVFVTSLPFWVIFKLCCRKPHSRATLQGVQTSIMAPAPDPTGASDEKQEYMHQLLSQLADHERFGLEGILEVRHCRAIKEENESFEPWRCAICHHYNDKPTYIQLLRFMKARDPTPQKMSIQLMSTRSRICADCKRSRRPIESFDYVVERISYVYFIMLLLPVLLILLGIPFVFSLLTEGVLLSWLERLASRKEELNEIEKEIVDDGHAKRTWTLNNFISVGSSVDKINEDLHAISSYIVQIGRSIETYGKQQQVLAQRKQMQAAGMESDDKKDEDFDLPFMKAPISGTQKVKHSRLESMNQLRVSAVFDQKSGVLNEFDLGKRDSVSYGSKKLSDTALQDLDLKFNDSKEL